MSSDIQEKIGKLCPEAQCDASGEFLLITVPDAKWHALAQALKDELHFDYLTALVGVDWKEELGVMYYLTNTETQEIIHVKVATTNRETPRLHSVSDLWAVANYQEREVFDFFGIEFINHPDMRRFFLRNDWVGYPLRKDYDDDPEKNPLRLDDEENEDDTYRLVEDENGNVTRIDGKVFGDDKYVINVGPQHPSTHGVMRYRASIEGELVKKVLSRIDRWRAGEEGRRGERLHSPRHREVVREPDVSTDAALHRALRLHVGPHQPPLPVPVHREGHGTGGASPCRAHPHDDGRAHAHLEPPAQLRLLDNGPGRYHSVLLRIP